MEERIDEVEISFVARNIKLTDYIKDYFKEKFEKVVNKIPQGLRKNSKIFFIYRKDGDTRSGAVIVTFTKKISPIYTEETADDPRVMIDILAEEIERQVGKLKTEFERALKEEMRSKREFIPAHTYEEAPDVKNEPNVQRIRVKIEKPISLDDAIIILEEEEKKKSGRRLPIFIFNDIDGKFKVIYKQAENNYTLFEVD